MAPTDVAIWTEHDQKTINSTTTPCTMIMYRTISNKFISGVYVPSLLFKSGSNAPVWNSSYQSSGDGFLDAANLSNWRLPTVKSPYHKHETPITITNRLLLAGSTAQKITSQNTSFNSTNYKSTFANFADTTFSIGTGLQIANATGGLHSSIATDKLVEMTLNDFTSNSNNNIHNRAYNSTDLNDYTTNKTTFVPNVNSVDKPDTFFVDDFSFPTTNWDTSSTTGIILEDIGIFDGIKCVGIQTASASSKNLSQINWTHGSSKSTFDCITTSGTTAEISMVTSADGGFTHGNSATSYISIDNTSLLMSHIVKGKYILKLNYSDNWTFDNTRSALVVRAFSMNNMSLTFSASPQSPSNVDLGSRVQLTWKVDSSNLNRVYKQSNDKTLSNTTGTDKVIYTENIRRLRTDGGTGGGNRSQDVLWYGDTINETISILPEKIWTTTTDNYIYDTYGLWFNASYTYYIDAYNVITGDVITNKSVTVNTKPGTPINWQVATAAPATDNPSIQMEWQNPLATGSANTITYKITRNQYTVSGIDVSDNSTVETTNISALVLSSTISSVTELIGGKGISIGGNYDVEDYLYNKAFGFDLQANASSNGGSSGTISNTEFTVPTGTTDISLNYTLDASQNTLGSIIQSKDWLDNPLTYENNYIVISLPENGYTFSDNTLPTEYQIFEKYKLIATIDQTKVDASGNHIILSRYWDNTANAKQSMINQRETFEGIWINVVAAKPSANKYSAVGPTKFIKLLPQPLAPAPHTVTNIKTNRLLNTIRLEWDFIPGTTDSTDPSTFGYIQYVDIYEIRIPSYIHYDNESDTSYNFTTNNAVPGDSNTIDTTSVYYTRLARYTYTESSHFNQKSYTASRTRWDNEIVAYRIVTANNAGVYSGQDPNDSTSGIIRWGTTQDSSSGTGYTDASYNDSFATTHIQGKTLPPAAATGVTLNPYTGSLTGITAQWRPTVNGQYSNDTNLGYGVSYVYNSVLGSGILEPSNNIIYTYGDDGDSTIAPGKTSPATNSWITEGISNLAPGSAYTVYVSVYTNMEVTHADNDVWTIGTDISENRTYTTATNSLTTSDYALVSNDSNSSNNWPSGSPIPLAVKENVYQDSTNSTTTQIHWKHPQYNSNVWNIVNATGATVQNTFTGPAYFCSKYLALIGFEAGTPTKMLLEATNASSMIDNYTMQAGDIIAVFDAQFNNCLDNYTYADGQTGAEKVLLCNKDSTGNSGFWFQLYKTADNTVHDIYVDSYRRKDKDGNVTQGASDLTKIADGLSGGIYQDLHFKFADKQYKVYHNGKHIDTKENLLYCSVVNSDANINNYDITYYTTIQDNDTAYSKVCTSVNESIKWTSNSPTGYLIELPPVMTIENPVKSNITYDADDNSQLVLGSGGTQEVKLYSTKWTYVSFYVIDTLKTTIHDLFGSITNLDASVGDVLNIYNSSSTEWLYSSANTGDSIPWDKSGDVPDEDIHYDKGYMVRLTIGTGGTTDVDGTFKTLTITGNKIGGMHLLLNQGPNFMGHPKSTPTLGSQLLNNTFDINNTSTSFWSQLIVVFNEKGIPLTGPYYDVYYDQNGPRATIDLTQLPLDYLYGAAADGGNGVMDFSPGIMYYTVVHTGLTFEIGSMKVMRYKGDFDNSAAATSTIGDVNALAKYLVQINPEFNDISGSIITENKRDPPNNWANIKSADGTAVGLNDLVYLTSMVKSVTGYENFPESGSQQASLS